MDLDFDKLGGLVAAVIQDASSGRVLMVGFMNREAAELTEKDGVVTFYSRSRSRLWTKGESSGHKLVVREMAVDCDGDALLIKVDALGPGVCHEGYESCFFRIRRGAGWSIEEDRAFDPEAVYGSQR